jgi:toxin ParE1/3/4
MDYRVTLTPQATGQIQQTMLYIAQTLQAPQTAKHWADLLYHKIAGLRFMPARHPLTEEEPWHTKGIHKMPVKNFLIYYLIDEKSKSVIVTAVIYGRRDRLTALAHMNQDR